MQLWQFRCLPLCTKRLWHVPLQWCHMDVEVSQITRNTTKPMLTRDVTRPRWDTVLEPQVFTIAYPHDRLAREWVLLDEFIRHNDSWYNRTAQNIGELAFRGLTNKFYISTLVIRIYFSGLTVGIMYGEISCTNYTNHKSGIVFVLGIRENCSFSCIHRRHFRITTIFRTRQ